MKLRPIEYAIAACSLGTAASLSLFASRATTGRQFISLAFLVGLGLLALTATVMGFDHWRTKRWSGLRPLGLALVGLLIAYGSAHAGTWVRELRFDRAKPAFEAVVARLERGELPLGRHRPAESVSPELGRCCSQIQAWRDSADQLVVEFWTDEGWPAKHSGYLYYAGDSVRSGSQVARRWYRGRRVDSHWYHVAN